MENEKNLDKQKLKKWKKVSIKNSYLYRFDFFIDNGIFRVGGQFKRVDLLYETKYLVILLRKSYVITLFIRYVYKWLGYVGCGYVILSLREKYWIIKVNIVARYVILKCVFCCRNYSRLSEQKMVDLFKNRIFLVLLFIYIGFDYFRFFIIKEGRKEVKRYGVFFTCLVS